MVVIISVIGAASCDSEIFGAAEEVGKGIAERGGVLISGGLGGVMEAASKGAMEAGGMTVGILPGFDKREANKYVQIPVTTGMSHARNVIIARSADALIAISGGYGTLSEIAVALKMGKPVIGLETWKTIDGIVHAQTPQEAVSRAFELTGK